MSEIKKETKPKKSTKTSDKAKVKKEIKIEDKPKTKKAVKKEEVILEEKTTKKRVKKVSKPKEIVKESALSTKEKKWYHVLSKIISIFAKIGKVLMMIAIPFVFLTMLLIPIIFKNFEANGNIIRFNDMSIIVRDETITFKIADNIRVLDVDENDINQVVSFLTDNSKQTIVISIELTLLAAGVILILDIYLMSYIEKLFGNFYKQDTPFTEENTNYIFKIGVTLIIIIVVDIIISIFDIIKENHSSGLLSILVVFVVYFVFKYATFLQKKSNDKICD